MSKLGLQVNYDHPITLELRRQICGAPSIRMFYGQNLMKGGTKCNAKIWPLPLGLNTHKYVEPAIISLFFLKGRVPTKSSYRTGGLLVVFLVTELDQVQVHCRRHLPRSYQERGYCTPCATVG